MTIGALVNMNRITISKRLFNGRPTVRNTGILVETILSLLACGAREEQILDEFTELDRTDICACVEFAFRLVAGRSHDEEQSYPPLRVAA